MDFNSSMNIFGELRVGSVPNHTGYIITIDPTTKRISYRTNAQIISDLGLTDAGVQVIQRDGLAIPNISGVVNIPLFDTTGAGLVPARVGSTQTRFLREDGTWVIPTNTTYGAMTLAELNTGTVTTARVVSAKTLNDWLNGKDYLTDTDLNGLLYNPTYNSTTHTFTMSIKGGGTFSIDFPIEELISNIYLDSNNNLVLVFEDGSTTSVPLNTLLVGVVKFVNGKAPNSLGEVTINIADIPNLQTELNGKVNITTQIIAGNGLTGGGALSANRTITLGTPSSITLASTNSVTTTSHTHEFAPGGTTSQYIDGTGALRAFPSIPTYSAGNGLTLTGTVFSLPVTINGTGNYVTSVVQNANGITVTKDTLPVYYNMPLLELNDATEVTGRIISAKTLNDWINSKNFVTADALNGLATQTWVNSNFAPMNHTHSTDQILVVIGYALGTNTPIANGQSLNEALGNIQAQINAKTNNVGTVTSVGASVAGNALNVAGTPITTTGTFAFTWGGSAAQYVNGLGNLVTFPTIPSYTAGTLAILNAGTSTTAQLWSASILNDWLNGKNYLTSASLNGYATQAWVLSQGYVTTDTVTRVGTTAGNVTSGDILIVGGGSNTVSKSGNTITVTGTNTTYSAGTGLSLSGTTFGQTITTSGSGTFVSSITQTANGFQINLGTPPNTTYSTDTLAILNAGTSTTGALQTSKNLNDWLNGKGFATITSLSNYITTNSTQTGLTGDKTSSGIWTFGQVRKAGQNDTQILLAGGGHRPVSDFALAGSLGNYVAKSGDIMSGSLSMQDNSVNFNGIAVYSPNVVDNLLNIRRYDKEHTVVNVMSPPQTSWGGAKEATLALVRGDNNEYFMDLYNMDYGTSTTTNYLDYGNPKMGLRLQKRGTGTWTPFYFEYSDGIDEVRALTMTPGNSTNTVNDTEVEINRLKVLTSTTSQSFIKNGFTDTQILLAGGGHRPVSDFALASSIPAQVNITQGAGITVSGTYPNITITNSAPNVTQVLGLSGNILSLSNGGGSVNLPTYTLPTASATVLGGIKVGTNLSIDANGVLSATNTNTTYTAGSGLTLSGTVFSLPVTQSGTGNAVTAVTQTTNGITVTKGATFLTSFTETDPIFTASPAFGITSGDITNWNGKQNALVAGSNITINPTTNVISATDTNTVTRLRGTTSGTYVSGDLTLLAGANTTITQSGVNITIASTNTTYTAGSGISITGTTIANTAPNIIQTLSQSGQVVTLSNGGGSFTLPTVPSYSTDTLAILNAGTSTTGSLQSSKNLNDWLNGKGYITSSSLPTVNNGQLSMSTGTGLTGSATFTSNQSGNSSFSVGIASGYVLPTTAQVNTWNSHTSNTGTVTSVGLTIGGNALNTNLATITTSGTFGVTWAGNANQYVNGAGNLATFPTIPTYTAGNHINITSNVVSAVLTDGVWLKDDQGFNRIQVGSTTTTNDFLFRGKYTGYADFKWQDAAGTNFMELLSGGVLRVNQLSGTGNRLLMADLSGSIFPSTINASDLATMSWVNSQGFATQTWVNAQGFITTSALANYVQNTRSIIAGNGITGGGTLAADRTITLGTPSSITLSSTNSVTASSHTHEFNPGGTASQYINGLGNLVTFPTLPTVNNGTLTLATSADLTGSATFSANQAGNSTFTVGLSTTTLSNIALGVTANGWGNHANFGYATQSWVNGQGYATQSWVQSQGYLTSIPNHDHVMLRGWGDTRNVATEPNNYNAKFEAKGIKTASVVGLNASIYGTYTSVVGYRGWSDSSGGRAFELGFAGNGQLLYRSGQTTAWEGWNELYHTGNLINVSQLVNNAGYITSAALNGYATQFWVNSQGFSTQTLSAGSNISIVGSTISAVDTVTRLRGTASGTYTAGDLTLLAGANTTITQSGANITIASANTTYTAGSGISISGTTISNTAPNVVQVLGLSGTTLSLSNGGGSVTLPSSPTYTAGANISISGSNVISATNTTYSAGNGLTLTGTSFSLPLTFSGSGTFVSNIEVTANGLTVTRSTPPNTITNIGVNNTNYTNGNINFVGGGNTSVTKSGNTVTISSSGGGSSIAYSREYKYDDASNEDYTVYGYASATSFYGLGIGFYNPDDGKWYDIFNGGGNNGVVSTIYYSPFTQVSVYNPATGNEVVRGTVDLSSFGLNPDQFIDEGQFHLCLMYQRTGGSQIRGSIRLVSMGEIISWKGAGNAEMFYGVYGIGYLTRFGTLVVSPMHY